MRNGALLAALILSVIATRAHAAEWWYVADSKTDVFFMDRASVTSASPNGRRAIRVWAAWFSSVADDRGVKSQKEQRFFDCADRSTATKSYIAYAPDGAVKHSRTSEDYGLRWEPVAPGTVGEAQLVFACNAQLGEGDVQDFKAEDQAFFFVPDLEKASRDFLPAAPRARPPTSGPPAPARKTIPKR